MPRKTLFDISVKKMHETEKAILYHDGKKKFWVPKSLIGDDGMIQVEELPDGTITLTAPESWLLEKELI